MKKQTPKTKRRQLSEIKKSIRKYQRLNENEGQATPYPFESVNDVMRYLADNNVSIIKPYLIKSINGTLEEEEENGFLTPERIGEVVEQIINAEVRR